MSRCVCGHSKAAHGDRAVAACVPSQTWMPRAYEDGALMLSAWNPRASRCPCLGWQAATTEAVAA